MSCGMGFPTMWFVRTAKPQISLRIRTVWSEPLLVAWIFYSVKLLTEHHLEFLSLKGGCTGSSESTLTSQNAALMEITFRVLSVFYYVFVFRYKSVITAMWCCSNQQKIGRYSRKTETIYTGPHWSCQHCKYINLSYDVALGTEIRPCNKIIKPLVVYRFTGNVMTSITTLRTCWQNHNLFTPEMRFQSICHMINRI